MKAERITERGWLGYDALRGTIRGLLRRRKEWPAPVENHSQQSIATHLGFDNLLCEKSSGLPFSSQRTRLS